MPRKYVPKPFHPKPLDPGARVTWEHRFGSQVVTRSGIVWSKAPKWSVNDVGDAAWVTPDEPLPADPYALVCVVTDRPAKYNPTPWSSDRGHPGEMNDHAANVARHNRAENARRANQPAA